MNLPFLLRTAQRVVHADDEPDRTEAGPFHTRCGHPRRRDD